MAVDKHGLQKPRITESIKKMQTLTKDLDGIDFLRSSVEALNNRDEVLNEDKSPIQLLCEYAQFFSNTLNNK